MTKINISVADEIKKFKELLDDGIIIQDEFNNKKKELLGKQYMKFNNIFLHYNFIKNYYC
ncbi:SHOCT domain-containing protein [Anaeromonas gelatinilytica]|uniref:SHOCT domain-containing protein n=1 Tax=Anaeromonas gelatinilytica TaxID=2683194 RepID=UPI0033153C9E